MMSRGSLSVFLCLLCGVLLLVPLSSCHDSVSDVDVDVDVDVVAPGSSSLRSEEVSENSAESSSSSSMDETSPTGSSAAAAEEGKEAEPQGENRHRDSDIDSDSSSDRDRDRTDQDKQSESQSSSKSADSSSSDKDTNSTDMTQSEPISGNETINANTTTSALTPSPQVEGAIFAGFQGQAFHFRAMADEVFNLVSSPHLQLNAHMTYIAAGDCTSDETICFSHPGAYMDELGFLVGPYKLQVTAGSRNAGLSLHVQGASIKAGQFPHGLRVPTTTKTPNMANHTTTDQVLIIRHDTHHQVTITTLTLQFVVINSDGFLSIAVSLLDANLLQLGSRRFNLSDPDYCHNNVTSSVDEPTQQQHQRGWIEKQMEQVYGKNQIHGLIGQTWRAATICDRDWIGNVQDYMCSGLFASDYVYSLYEPAKHS